MTHGLVARFGVGQRLLRRWLTCLLIAALGLAGIQAGPAAGAAPPADPGDLAALMRADGSLRTDRPGSYDARGWRLSTAADGSPRFEANSAPPATGVWDARFAAGPHEPGEVNVALVAPNGDLYLGGTFSRIAGMTAYSVVRWDGTQWSDLGTAIGQTTTIMAMAFDGANLYVAGFFENFAGVPARHIARWDGSAWHPVGNGMDGLPGLVIYTMAICTLAAASAATTASSPMVSPAGMAARPTRLAISTAAVSCR